MIVIPVQTQAVLKLTRAGMSDENGSEDNAEGIHSCERFRGELRHALTITI